MSIILTSVNHTPLRKRFITINRLSLFFLYLLSTCTYVQHEKRDNTHHLLFNKKTLSPFLSISLLLLLSPPVLPRLTTTTSTTGCPDACAPQPCPGFCLCHSAALHFHMSSVFSAQSARGSAAATCSPRNGHPSPPAHKQQPWHKPRFEHQSRQFQWYQNQ